MSAHPAKSETDSDQTPPPRRLLQQLLLQCSSAFAVLSVAWPYFVFHNKALPWLGTTIAIGGIALLIASITSQPWWWRLMHTLFAPLAWSIAMLSIDPGWFLLTFILTLLVYRGALTGQIPLYLSNSATVAALAQLTSGYKNMRFLDLGAGIGSVLHTLSQTRPDAQLTGIENAPATWLLGYLRTFKLANCNWRWCDIWRTNLSEFDVVYAFLSPAPMSALWEKAQHEMRPGSLFISNSFAVPGVEAHRMVKVDDTRKTQLYCYLLDCATTSENHLVHDTRL